MSVVEENGSNSTPPPIGGVEIIEKIPKQMLLIKLVAQEEALFNNNHDNYRNVLRKEKLWRKIAQSLGWTEERCKAKWKAMRDQYCRELKRARANPNASIKWKYYQPMGFLRPYALHRRALFPVLSSYQIKRNYEQQQKAYQDEIMSSNNVLTSQAWNVYTNSSEMNDSNDFSSEIIVEMHPDGEAENEELTQDDEDDDPIHTFLNIESYFEKELIMMVKAEEILYDYQNSSYRNVKLKYHIWEQIARKLKRTVRQCRLKWKALRDQYIREHKRLLYMSDGNDVQRWKHYDALSFLENFIRVRNGNNGMLETLQKPEISISSEPSENLEDEQMMTEPTEDQDESQFMIRDQEPEGVFFKSTYSQLANEHNTIEETSNIPAVKGDDDEVGVFFRAIAMKIRNANMPAMAFTELQIDILRVINNALRD